jgi:hypothetical protein
MANASLPEQLTSGILMRLCETSLKEDKPVYFDYFTDSVSKKCCIGVAEGNVKFLVKSGTEYTSPIATALKCEQCFILTTENSIYVVSADIPVKRIVNPPKDE